MKLNCLLAATVLMSANAATPPPVYMNIPARDFATGTGTTPLSVAIGDFNGDGKLDVATANGKMNNVSVLLGKGGLLGFTPAQRWPAGRDPVAIVAGDFNGDGKLDLAVSNKSANLVSVLLGSGKGSFGKPKQTAVGGTNPVALAAADFNGDGKLDLAVVNSGSGNVTILLGNGDGTFRTGSTVTAQSLPNSVAIGDFNGDGEFDLAIANGNSNTVSIALGNGDGTFGAAVSPAAGTNPISVVVGDFNGDGNLDVAVADSTQPGTTPQPFITLLLGKGDGRTFTEAAVSADWYATALVAGDFNGDGILDLGEASNYPQQQSYVQLFYGSTTGMYGYSAAAIAGLGPAAIGAADFNGDGRLDLITANSAASTISVLYNSKGALFQPTSYSFQYGNFLTQCFSNAPELGVADVNGDGKLDVIAVGEGSSFNGEVCVLPGTSSGAFGTAYPLTTLPSIPGPGFVVGDFNRDGKPDLAIDLQNGNVLVYLNGSTESIQYSPGGTPISISTADLNGDGILDLVTANGPSLTVSILLGNSNGGFQPAIPYYANGTVNHVAIGDFNGDGYPDLICALGGSELALLLGNGDGTFQSPLTVMIPGTANALTVGDFNRDGKLDVAVTIPATGTAGMLSVLVGNGNGTFQSVANYPVGISPNSLTAADFDGDGIIDLAMAASGENNFEILIGQGDGKFRDATSGFFAGADPTQMAIGDLNGDGKPDVVIAGPEVYSIYVLLNATP